MRTWSLMMVALLGACSGDGAKDTVPTTVPPTDTQTTPPPNSTDADLDGYALPFDCDDNDPNVHPEAYDAPYDGVDADCAGDSDFDADGDTFDSADYGAGNDCDDTDPDINPLATEQCDGIDNDCDGTPDSPVPKSADTWWLDDDGDTFGSDQVTIQACTQPKGYSSNALDCDDADPATAPYAPPVACDGKENDCDTFVLEPSGGAQIDGTGYPDLASAVAAAQPGDQIDVCEGEHVVAGLTLTFEVTLSGLGAADVTLLDGGGGPLLGVATPAPVVIEDVTLTNGFGFPAGIEPTGGGLNIGDNANVTLRGVDIWGNHAGQGAGIFAGDNVSLTLESTDVHDNTADLAFTVSGGGGVSMGTGGTLVLDGTTIDSNIADTCAGIELGIASDLDGSATSSVSNNVASLRGGGVCVSSGTIDAIDILQNEAATGAGVDGNDYAMTDVVVADNFAVLSAGGLFTQGNTTLVRVTLDNNEGGIESGAIETIGNGSVLTLTDSAVINNVASFFGAVAGGVMLQGGVLISTNTDWGDLATDNSPADVGFISGATHNAAGIDTFQCDATTSTCL